VAPQSDGPVAVSVDGAPNGAPPGPDPGAQISLRARLGRGTFFNTVGSAVGQGSTLLVNMAVARMLGLERFGQYALIQTSLLTAAFVAQLATGNTATKYVAEFRSTDPERAGRVAGLCALSAWATSTLLALLVLLAADWLAARLGRAPGLGTPVRFGVAFIVFNCVNFYQVGTLAGLESYPSLARTGIAGGVASVAISVPLTWWFGLSGAAAALALTAGARWVICQRALKRELHRTGLRINYHDAWQERGILWRFALPAALSGFFTMPATWLATVFLVRQNNGFAQNALYSAAGNLKTLVTFLASNVNSVGLSMLNNQKGIDDRDRYRRLYFANIAICTGLVIVFAAALLASGPYVLRLFGERFGEGRDVLDVLMLAALVETVSLGVYQIIQSHERMWSSLFLIALPASLALPALSWLLTPDLGARGLALAVLGSTLIHLVTTCVVAFPVARRFLSPRPDMGPSLDGLSGRA
jgi:O-antigen/teichoic acid export membrane protein